MTTSTFSHGLCGCNFWPVFIFLHTDFVSIFFRGSGRFLPAIEKQVYCSVLTADQVLFNQINCIVNVSIKQNPSLQINFILTGVNDNFMEK